MTWEEKYSVGIDFIDDQHKKLFFLFDKLLDALKFGKAQDTVIEIINELENYANTHFYKEEFFFNQFNYSDSDDHIKEHKQFVEKLNLIKSHAQYGKLVTSLELISFLKNWTINHIMIVDIKYKECFLKNGLK